MDRIELVGIRGDDAPLDRLFEPRPLKHRGLENRCRRIGVVLQQLRRTVSVETKIEAAIEAGFIAVPAFGDQRPECFPDLQPAKYVFVVDRIGDQFEAHGVDFACRLFDLAFDFVETEGVTGAFVPVARAVDGVKIKPGFISS